MTSQHPSILRTLLRELITIVPSEYVILISQRTNWFLRIRSSGAIDILTEQPGKNDASLDIASFFAAVKNHPVYLGQPVSVLLNDSSCFLYARRRNSLSSSELLERAKLFNEQGVISKQLVTSAKLAGLFMYQGVKKEALEAIRTAASLTAIPIIRVTSLRTELLLGAVSRMSEAVNTVLCELPGNEWVYICRTETGDVLHGKITASSADEAQHKLDSLPPPIDDTKPPTLYRLSPDASQKAASPTGRLLRSRSTTASISRRLFFNAANRRAGYLQIALNSGRLLASVLVSCALAAAIASIVLAMSADSGSSELEQFQIKYQERTLLESNINSLRDRIEQHMTVVGRSPELAAILGVFCQERPAGLWLTDLSIQYASDSLQLAIRGRTKKEDAVFEYMTQLRRYSGPIDIDIESVRPLVSTKRGAAGDTMFVFDMAGSSIEK